MTSAGDLSTTQRVVIAALVAGLSKQEAAESAGVRPATVSRYLRQPRFRAALREAQDDALGSVTREMTAGASDMLEVLQSVAQDATMPPAVRVRASLGWLAQVWRAVELHDLALRLDELERILAADDGH